MILAMLCALSLLFLIAVARRWKSSSLCAKQQQQQQRKSKLPKGAWCLPWIGETVQYFTQSPYQFYHERVSRYGGIFRSHLQGYPTVLTSTEEAARFVLVAHHKSFQPYYPIVGQFLGLNTMKKGLLDTIRKSLDIQTFPKPPLRSQRDYITSIDSIARWVLSAWDTQSPVRTAEESRKFTFHVVLHAILTLAPCDESMKLMHDYIYLLSWMESPRIRDLWSRSSMNQKKKEEIQAWLLPRIVERRTESVMKNDILQFLMGSVDENGEKLTDDELKECLFPMFIGGFETTAALLGWIIKYLAENPEVLQNVKAEHQSIRMAKTSNEEPLCCSDLDMMPLTWRVIQETLRLANIVPHTIREIVDDVDFKGILFPKGWKAYISFLSVHLSPKNYKNPLKFDPSRFEVSQDNGAYMPFGLGNHTCVGRLLVKLEIMIFIHYLVITYR
ncbi:hypothetical protein O6H91_15G004100 [Diphasiastrum complanatum]|uniref:Uncharacterized protein n=1 Tax=Diphasiastrum complanatum TaxID=34168 RepID=A0ACC2BG66_DIPCM|nr:hypothetical protein O6H91_15G004100 [Diphasiastrum complanatum]